MECTTWQTHSCLCRHLEASSLCLYLVSPHSQGPRGGHCLLSRRTHLRYHWLLVYVCVCASVCWWTCDSLILYYVLFFIFFQHRVSLFVLSSWADKVKELISIHTPVPTQTGANWEDTAAAGWSGSLSVTHFIRRCFSVPPSRQLTVPWCAAYWFLTVFYAGVNMLCIGWCWAEFIVAVCINNFAHFAGVLNMYQIISTGY